MIEPDDAAGRLARAAADLAEVGAEHERCRGCRCFRGPAEEALALLDSLTPAEQSSAYLRKLLASPVAEHG